MKILNIFTSTLHRGSVALCLMAFCVGSAIQSKAVDASDDYAQKLSQAHLFLQPLVWVGTNAPDTDQTHDLYVAAGLDENNIPTDRVGSMEAYINSHPNSPWVPSLQANLARYYRSQGRYGAAMDAWQQAWEHTKGLTDANSIKVADYSVAYWAELLASLGRIEKLQELVTSVNGRQLSKPEFQREFDLARQAVVIMGSQPGESFRCGSVALYHVARALGAKSDISEIEKMKSPATGFSLEQLAEISDQYGLGLSAVKRTKGSELVVPSVIHWKEDHYAAIVEGQSGGYRVIDPTFGKPQWLSADAINENASGYFLVPTNHIPAGWQTVAASETVKIFGKGIHNGNTTPSGPKCDGDGNPCTTGTCPYDCPPGSSDAGGNGGGDAGGGAGGGGGGSGTRPPGMLSGGNGCSGNTCGTSSTSTSGGMPDWEVQEPYISVWLHDRPMFYNMSFGRKFLFQIDYHQLESDGGRYDYTFGDFGPNWNCNLLTYVLVHGIFTNATVYATNVVGGTIDVEPFTVNELDATEFCPDGGQRNFTLAGTNGSFLMDPRTHVRFAPVVTNIWFTNSLDSHTTEVGYTAHYLSNNLVYPNGSVAVFDDVITLSEFPNLKLALITSATDPQGRVMRYSYTNSGGETLLAQVVDFDGKTNNFIYGNGSFPTSITQVTNTAYGLSVNFKYDANGRLTNVVDVAGISSSFTYTFTNEVYYTNDDSGHRIAAITNSAWMLTKLTTPYGDTKFDYFHATWPLFGRNVDQDINRAVTVTQPDSGKQLFLYSDEALYWDPVLLPDAPSNGTTNPGFNTNYNAYLAGTTDGEPINNSFHWGPRQYGLLSTTVLTNLNQNDFILARVRDWLHANPENVISVGQVLNAEGEPSPDGGATYGKQTWYSYEGKPSTVEASLAESTNDDLPIGFGYSPDPSVISVYYNYLTRNSNGFSTSVVDFGWGASMDTLRIRTNFYVYAANNIDLLQHIGPDGIAQETYGYTNHQVAAMTNALQEFTLYTYNGMSQVTGITHPNGLITTNIYGPDGFLQTTYDYVGIIGYRTNTYTYTNGLVRTHTDERGLTTTNTWDALQRLTRVDYPDGTSMTYVYSNLDIVRVIDRMGFTNSYTYDNMRRKIGETNANGYATVYSYCTCGALETIQDALGNTTHFSYDTAGRLTNTVYADVFSIGRKYNISSQLLSVTSSSGKRTDYLYDGVLRRIEVDNLSGGSEDPVATYGYDVNDLVTNQTDANGVSLGMTYDALHRLRTRTYPDGGVEGFGYSANVVGMTSYTNQLKNFWTYAYDLLQRKTNEISTSVYTNSFAYSPASDLLTLVDGKSQNTAWKFDQFGRVTNKQDNLGTNLFIYGYDANNRLTNRTSAAKGLTKYSYDNVGNLTFIDYPVSPDITLQYDALNRLTNMVDAVGATRYVYDYVGQILSEDGPWDNDTVNYTYANRLRTGLSVAAPNASPWSQAFAYDEFDRMTNVTSPAGAFGYYFGYNSTLSATDPGSLVRKLSLPGGAYITNKYDSNARMTATYLRNSGDTNLDSEEYVYNLGNQRTQQVFTAGNFENYSYDTIGELKTAIGKELSGTTNRMQEQFGYVYDAAGNLNYRTNNTLLQQFSVNSLNELTTVTNGGKLTVAGTTTSRATSVTVNSTSSILYLDSSFASTNQSWANGNNTYTAIAQDSYSRKDTNIVVINLQVTNVYAYDSNGNMVTNGTSVLEYDDENQLIRITQPNAWKSEFAYDGRLRRRIRKEYIWNGSAWLETNEVRYVYDRNLVIQERDRNNLPQVTYTRGRDLSGSLQGAGGIAGLLARTDVAFLTADSSLATTFYHADGNGNITALIYTNQSVAAKYEYDSFGNVSGKVGTLADINQYQFSSKEFHAQSGLIYYLFRFYDPNLQRWANRDPLSAQNPEKSHVWGRDMQVETVQGVNLYTAFFNDPLNQHDRDGRFVQYVIPLIIGGGIMLYVTGCSKHKAPSLTDPFGCWAAGDPKHLHEGLKGPMQSGTPEACREQYNGCYMCCEDKVPINGGTDEDYKACQDNCAAHLQVCGNPAAH